MRFLLAWMTCALLALGALAETRADETPRVDEEEAPAVDEESAETQGPVPKDASQEQYQKEQQQVNEAKRVHLAPDDITSQLGAEWFSGLLEYDLFSAPWREFNDTLRWTTGLDLGIAYTIVYQGATSGAGPTSAAAGDFDFFGSWHLIGAEGDDDGRLGFRTEIRHDFGGIPPSELNVSIGSIVRTTNGFSVHDFQLREIWWQQNLFDGRAYFRAGQIAQRDFFSRSRFQSDNFFFLNQAFSSSPAVPFPGTGPGIAGFVHAAEWLDVGAGLGLANPNDDSRLTDLFDDSALFAAVELAFRTDIDGWGPGAYRFTFSNTDESENAPGGTAFSLSFDQHIDNVVPFVRYAFSDGTGLTAIQSIVTTGVGVFDPLGNEGDVFGLAFAWIHPDQAGARDQWVIETFYRIQLTPAIQLTPDLQIIMNPSFNTEDDVVAVLGLRFRIQY